jgi:hypothetical protein
LLDFTHVDLHKDVMEESTPPPLPQTPPSPESSQPPRAGWWSRNWKWFVPTGCFTLIALGVVFVVCIFAIVFGALKSSDAYKTALARAKEDRRVTAALGTPIKDGLVPSGKTNVEGSSGQADLAIPISGPKGKGTIYAVAAKSGGEWTFSKLTVKTDAGETIDLEQSSEAGSTSGDDDMDLDETTDERVDAITLAHEVGGKLEPVRNFKRADSPEHIVIALTEGNEETHVRTVWTNLNAGGARNQKLWEKELVTDENNRRADFALSNSNGKSFPPGDYKIDIYLDDELIQTVRYKVQ